MLIVLTSYLKPYGECKICRKVDFPNSCSDCERISMAMLCCRKTDVEVQRQGREQVDCGWWDCIRFHMKFKVYRESASLVLTEDRKMTFSGGKKSTLVGNVRQNSSMYA